jgi:hypothetical protein
MLPNRKSPRKTTACARRPLKPKQHQQIAAVFPGLEALRGQRAPSTLRDYFRDAVLYLCDCAWDSG